MKLFKSSGLRAAQKALSVDLRRLSWLGLAIAAALTGTDSSVVTFVVATVWWFVLQAAAFVILARVDVGNDTS